MSYGSGIIILQKCRNQDLPRQTKLGEFATSKPALEARPEWLCWLSVVILCTEGVADSIPVRAHT